MSWVGRIVNVKPLSPLSAVITVSYFDDADPQNSPTPLVYLHTFNYSTNDVTDQAAFVAALQEEGKKARTSYEHTNELVAALPLGAQVVIEA